MNDVPQRPMAQADVRQRALDDIESLCAQVIDLLVQNGVPAAEACAAVAGKAIKAAAFALFVAGRRNIDVLRLVSKALPRLRKQYDVAAAAEIERTSRRIITPGEAH